uniref:Uncharacterized protein n=1 Tax=Peromyscus maniculatus bairdii TaxID=230844 RepID=A0A8C8UBC7_PERMB
MLSFIGCLGRDVFVTAIEKCSVGLSFLQAVGNVSETSVGDGRNNWFFRLLRKCDLCG